MRCFNLFKCCKGGTGVDLDYLPPARAIELKKTGTKRINSFLPISSKPIPELDVSPSSSTSLAMFDFAAITSVPFGINSFTAQGNFEDVDLSSPINFCSPPAQARKALSSPFEDHYEIDRTLAINGNPSGDEEGSYSSSPCSTEPSVLFDQSSRVNSWNTCPSPFGDEHEFDYDVEYAPTTHPSKSEYTERALEYQRGKFLVSSLLSETHEQPLLTTASVCLLFGPGSVEYNNLQRDHALAVLEGVKPQRNDPLRQVSL